MMNISPIFPGKFMTSCRILMPELFVTPFHRISSSMTSPGCACSKGRTANSPVNLFVSSFRKESDMTNLKDDPQKFVQKSVGNNLNDLYKDAPEKADFIKKKATGESPHFHAVPHICRPATATTQD